MKNFKAHILIVDDDDRIRDLVKEYLNQNNYLVSTAKDSNDAFEKTKIIKFDLIVLEDQTLTASATASRVGYRNIKAAFLRGALALHGGIANRLQIEKRFQRP